ncbi:MAG: hypothetical protein ACO3JI_02120 [Steroidobacteraceae bacterium]
MRESLGLAVDDPALAGAAQADVIAAAAVAAPAVLGLHGHHPPAGSDGVQDR